MRKSILVSILCLFAFSNYVFSSNSEKANEEATNLVSFTGQVIDQNSGEALAGVLLRFEESGANLYTDFEGRFELSGITPGKYKMQTNLISYESLNLDIDLNGENNEPMKIKISQVSIK